MVVCVRCPICGRPVLELDYEVIDIDEVFEGVGSRKEEEALTPPKPSWLYRCANCLRYVPWDKVKTVIRNGKILLYRCPFCGEEVFGEKTAATWLDQQELTITSKTRSFLFELKGDPCPECGDWPFTCRAEIGYALRCARCGATLMDFLCWFCQHGKEVSEPDCCKIKHFTGRVTFCLDFKPTPRTQI